MKTEDVIFSHLRTRYPELLATALGGIEPRRAKVEPVALPTVSKLESDFALRVLRPGPPRVLHIEHWSSRGDLALTAFYHMWYHEATRLPVRTIVVTTSQRLAQAVPSEYAFRVGSGRATRVPLEPFHLWRLRARTVMDRRQVVLYPFVPLMRDPRSGRALLEELRDRIMQDVETERDRADLKAAAYFIATKRFGEGLLDTVLGGVEVMAKTDLGQKLIEKGRMEEKAVSRRATLLRLLRAKFGAVPEDMAGRVEALEDVERLDALLERILTATSIADMGL